MIWEFKSLLSYSSLEKKVQTVEEKTILKNLNILMYTNGWEIYEKRNCCISHQEDANCGEYVMYSEI